MSAATSGAPTVERDLVGKTALITGSGRNIGRAVGLEFAARGANIVINSRSNRDEAESTANEVRALGVGAVAVVGDVSEQATIDELASVAIEAFGAVDIYVSNAALRPYQSFFDTSYEDWQRVLDIQLGASYRLARAFVPGMVDKGWGRVIHITGPDAYIGMSRRIHNVTAKGGIRAMTKALAVELGPFGITVNDVAPGAIDTLFKELSHPHVSPGGPTEQAKRDVAINRIPVGRLGQPEDIAFACAFLASPRASFVTGTVIPCCGGEWSTG